jgi:L-ascorbate metabolism protein UlaG (beta-lactamase superfamily)
VAAPRATVGLVLQAHETSTADLPSLSARLVGGPTALLEYAGLRWLTDPTFSAPGEYAGGLVKTTGPAVAIDELNRIDVVLLSHDHHADNLDPAGRELALRAGRVFTTKAGAARLGGGVVGLDPWDTATLDRPDGASVSVTALPALHGPPGCEEITGPVIGFLLSGDGLSTVYVSGDNASLDVVRDIGQRVGPVDVAILFAGAVQLTKRFDGAYLTLSADRAAEATLILDARVAIPLHFEGWAHVTQGADELRAAFHGNGVAERLRLPERGETVEA